MAVNIYQNKTKYLIGTAAVISAALFLCPYIYADSVFEHLKKVVNPHFRVHHLSESCCHRAA